MEVSLIVTAEPDRFQHKERNFLASFAAQTFPHDRFELIVVDAYDRPDTAAAVAAVRRQHPALQATLLSSGSTARASGNNLGAAHARGRILVFLADDFDPAPGLVAAHAAYHAMNADLDAVGIGPGLFPEDIRKAFFARWVEDSGHIFGVPMRRTLAIWPRGYFYAGNASIKKGKFDALGGFDEHFLYDAWDDYEFGLRLADSGGYSQFLAAAVATHRHAVSFEERRATMERAGESARVLEQLHPERDHGWRAMVQHGALARLPEPANDAPAHATVAYYYEQFAIAFRRGYLGAAPDAASPTSSTS